MSIRPIDFNGMIQNSQEVGNIRSHEEARPAVEQQTIAAQNEVSVEEHLSQVNEFENAESGEDKMDAKDGGNGSYQGGSRRRRQKKEPVREDRVILKGQMERFDITI